MLGITSINQCFPRLVKFKGIHRTFGFFPNTISAVAVGFIWRMIYDYKKGILIGF